jgi:hypothetical protein
MPSNNQFVKVLELVDKSVKPLRARTVATRAKVLRPVTNSILKKLVGSGMLTIKSGTYAKTNDWSLDAAHSVIAGPIVDGGTRRVAQPNIGTVTFSIEDVVNLPEYKRKAQEFDRLVESLTKKL